MNSSSASSTAFTAANAPAAPAFQAAAGAAASDASSADDLDASTVLGAAAGLLREGWSRLDSLTETLASSATSNAPSTLPEKKLMSIAEMEPAEIISRLQKQLRRAEGNSKKIAERAALLVRVLLFP